MTNQDPPGGNFTILGATDEQVLQAIADERGLTIDEVIVQLALEQAEQSYGPRAHPPGCVLPFRRRPTG